VDALVTLLLIAFLFALLGSGLWIGISLLGVAWLGMELWRKRWSAAGWREYLEAGESQAALVAIRHNTHTGRPLGSAEFLRAVEGQTKRRLALQKRGPKRAAEPGKSQGTFSFGA